MNGIQVLVECRKVLFANIIKDLCYIRRGVIGMNNYFVEVSPSAMSILLMRGFFLDFGTRYKNCWCCLFTKM